jgi:hypothetical protein
MGFECGGAQGRDKGGRFPVTMRDFADQPFTAQSAAEQAGHVD